MLSRILTSAKPEWMVDLTVDQAVSERTRMAVEAGLRSGFGFPVLVDEKVIGVLEFFSLRTAQPDLELLKMLEHVGLQLGRVVIRQRAQDDLQRAKASAESANRAKSEFLTTMSHEMRTPMNAMLGMADLLSESALLEEQRGYVEIFQKAGANLLTLINDILDLAKVESGHLELECIAFDLGPVLERIRDMMISRAADRGLQLTLEISQGTPMALMGDPNRLRQILINLLGNAIKFTDRGSVILRVEPEPAAEPGCLRFSVIDTGIGIPLDMTTLIFERFTQADSSTTRKYGGTGLGLAISKGLAEIMGGRIDCRSEVGRGSVFSLVVPFVISDPLRILEAPGAALPVSRAADARGSLPAIRILIAEDSEYNLALIKAYLKDSTFLLDVAENGKVALDKAMATRPDLILMDVQMPVMDGLDATRAIRKWEASTGARPIPILTLTADAAQEGEIKSLQAGCSEHLIKPIKRTVLLQAISRHIHHTVRITPPAGIEGMVPGYLASVRRDLDSILAAVNAKDCKIAGRLGHQFKGTGHGYGFPEIAQTGAAIEVAAKVADESEIRRQILSLGAYLDRVEIAV